MAGNERRDWGGAVLYLLLALMNLGLFAAFVADESVPEQSSLSRITAQMHDLNYRSGNSEQLEFRLEGQPLRFEIPSQAANLGDLGEALDAASGPVSVLYDPNDRSHPVFSEDDFYPVYAIERGGVGFLSYEQARQGFESDYRLGLWLSGVWLALAAMFSVGAWRALRRHAVAD